MSAMLDLNGLRSSGHELPVVLHLPGSSAKAELQGQAAISGISSVGLSGSTAENPAFIEVLLKAAKVSSREALKVASKEKTDPVEVEAKPTEDAPAWVIAVPPYFSPVQLSVAPMIDQELKSNPADSIEGSEWCFARADRNGVLHEHGSSDIQLEQLDLSGTISLDPSLLLMEIGLEPCEPVEPLQVTLPQVDPSSVLQVSEVDVPADIPANVAANVAGDRSVGREYTESGSQRAITSLTPAQEHRIVQRVLHSLESVSEAGGVMKIRLHPQELGSLHLSLRTEAGQVYAVLEVENSAAKDALLQNANVLRERLQRMGMEVKQFDVYVATGDATNQSPAGFRGRSSGEKYRTRESRYMALQANRLSIEELPVVSTSPTWFRNGNNLDLTI